MNKLRKKLAVATCVLLLLSMTCNSVLAVEIPSGEGMPNTENTLNETGDPEPKETEETAPKEKETGETAPKATESGQDETKEEELEGSETNETESDITEPGDSESDGPDSEETESDETLPEEGELDEETNEKAGLLSVSQKDMATVSLEGEIDLIVGENMHGTVTLTEDGKLEELPDAPNREGWKFAGWYTDKVEEVYLAGGDPEPNSTFNPQVSISKEDTVNHIREELAGTHKLEDLEKEYSGNEKGLNEKLLSMHHTWVIYTRGRKVKAGDKLSEIAAIYAKYTPENAEIIWDADGWKTSAGALHSGRSYGSYVYPWMLNPPTWGDRTFTGWSFTRGGEVALYPNTVYQVGEEPLEWDKFKSGKVRLYAVWDGETPRFVSKITVTQDKSNNRLRHFNNGWRVMLYYKIEPEDAIYDSVEWSSDQPGYVSIDQQSGNNAVIFVDNNVQGESVTVTVSAGGKTGDITIPVKHDWVLQYKQDPTCKAGGYALYKCTGCQKSWQPKLPQTDHKFKSDFFAATCTEEGYRLDECTYCGFTQKIKTEDAKNHDWKTTEVTGCGGKVTTSTCQVCGYTESDVDADAAVHQWESSPRIDKAPTCFESGSRSTHCSICGLTKDSEVIPADPNLHAWRGWVLEKPATYEERGLESRECNICKTTETKEIEVLILGESNPPSNIPGSGSGSSGSSSSGSNSGGSSSGGSGSGGSGSGGSSSGRSSQSSTFRNNAASGSSNESAYVPSVVPGSGSQVTTVVSTVEDGNVTAGVTNAQIVSGAWSQNEQGDWSLSYGDGTVASNTWVCVTEADGAHWYHFGDTGLMDSGWLNLDGKVYFLHDAHDGTAGRMLTGWQLIGEKWYYFSKEEDETIGLLLTDTTTPDGYKVNAKGEWIQ